LWNGAKRRRGAEIRADLPTHRSIPADDGETRGLAATDDDIFRRETLVARIEPVVGPDICGGIDVQPIEGAARCIITWRGGDNLSRIFVEVEIVNVIAGHPFPNHFTSG